MRQRGSSLEPNAGFLERLLATLLGEADVLRRWGATGEANAVEQCVAAFQDALRKEQAQLVSLAEAAAYSGYSKDHLRRLARTGSLRHTRRGRRQFYELGDLPIKPTAFDVPQLAQYDVAADARQVIARRSRGETHETQTIAACEGRCAD
jgi:hypothetical protein